MTLTIYRRVLDALRRCLLPVLLITALLVAAQAAMDFITGQTNAAMTQSVEQTEAIVAAVEAAGEAGATDEKLAAAYQEAISAPLQWLSASVIALPLLLAFSTVLMLLLTRTVLGGMRASAPTLAGRSYLRAILLQLLLAGLALLWSLPGMALKYAATLMPSYALFVPLDMAGVLLTAAANWLVTVRYAAARPMLADHPDKGVTALLRDSRAMLSGHGIELFTAAAPLLLVQFLLDQFLPLGAFIVVVGAMTTLLSAVFYEMVRTRSLPVSL